jgi:general secretion pathway protein K
MSITDMRAKSRGGALLAVLWLSAALAAIAFALANTVRGETERASTAVDGLRSGYLATGAVRRAILYMDWGRFNPDNPRYKPMGNGYAFDFPEGHADVEVIPETAKLSINVSKPEDLLRLLSVLGVQGERAQEIVAAILDWRDPQARESSAFDPFYQSLSPPYIAPHYLFGDIEELLSVKGVTPDLFYGTWDHAPEGSPNRLIPRAGLRDCVSVFGTTDQFDANTAAPALLAAIGVSPEGIAAIVQQRRVRPFRTPDELAPLESVAGEGFARLGIGGHSIFTVRATARLRLQNGQLSDLRRTEAALVKLMPAGYDAPYHVLRWYDSATPSTQ